MKIRHAKREDFKEIFKILNGASELRHVRAGNNYNKEWVRDMLTNKSYLSLIAEERGKIVGFLIAEFWKDEKYSFMLDMFVMPEHRRNGIATMLEREYEKLCRKAKMKMILTSVIVSNKKMQKFMGKRGYEKGTEVYYFEKTLR
jgi:ribosomal protein S18 acetylase RimI-like enzyme